MIAIYIPSQPIMGLHGNAAWAELDGFTPPYAELHTDERAAVEYDARRDFTATRIALPFGERPDTVITSDGVSIPILPAQRWETLRSRAWADSMARCREFESAQAKIDAMRLSPVLWAQAYRDLGRVRSRTEAEWAAILAE